MPGTLVCPCNPFVQSHKTQDTDSETLLTAHAYLQSSESLVSPRCSRRTTRRLSFPTPCTGRLSRPTSASWRLRFPPSSPSRLSTHQALLVVAIIVGEGMRCVWKYVAAYVSNELLRRRSLRLCHWWAVWAAVDNNMLVQRHPGTGYYIILVYSWIDSPGAKPPSSPQDQLQVC